MTSSVQSDTRKLRIIQILRGVLEETSGIDTNEYDETVTFFEMGMDSLFLTQVSMALSKKFNVKISFRQLLEEYTNFDQLSQFIDSALPPEALPSQLTSATSSIAVPPVIKPAAAPAVAASSLRTAAPLTMPIFDSFSPSAPAGTIESLISQQLQLMARQIEVLGGGNCNSGIPMDSTSNISISTNQTETQTAAEIAYKKDKPEESRVTPEEAPKPFGAIARITLTKDNLLTPKQLASLESITNRYISRTIGSKRLSQANRSFLAEPRVVSGFTPSLKEIVYPIHVNRSSGCRLWDVDGNEYIDMLCGFGSNFFGNIPPFVTDALKHQIDQGIEIGPIHPLAGEVGKLFCEMTNSDRVAFCNTGSEAVLGAMRVARTVTGRSKIAIFANSYHGIFDEVIVRGSKKLRTTPAAPGIMPECVQNVIVLDYGTPEALEIIRQKTKDGELAAVLCEPVQSRHPALQPREFLHEVRKITEETDTALIFDEVITGFRIGQGGAQDYFGVKADLATYGKVIGGGLPLGVIAGKKKWMDALDGGFWSFGDTSTPEVGVTYFAGTFVRHPLALAAAKAVLIYLKKEGPELQKRINERTTRFVGELNAWFTEVGAPINIEHFATQFKFIFTQDLMYSELFAVIMRTKGIHILDGFPGYLSLAHTEEDIAFALRVIKEAVLEMQEAGFMPGNKLSYDTQSNAGEGYALTVPSTESQREIWASAQMGEDASLAFNEAVSVKLIGSLDVSSLQKSIQLLIQRHDSLRTIFSADGTKLHVAPSKEITIYECDLSDVSRDVVDQTLQSLLDEAVKSPFDLERGPLFRVHIVRISDNDHLLILAAHHIICDGWSYTVLLRELGILYRAIHAGTKPELEPPDSFCSYSLAMSTREQTPEFEIDEKFWLEIFSRPFSLLDIPLDAPRPKRKTYSSLREDYLLPSDLVQAVKKAGAKQGCSFFVTMLGAFNVLLHRLSGQDEIVLGIPTAGQSAAAKYNLVGHCVNTLTIKCPVNSEGKFVEFLKTVKSSVLDAQDHQQYTYGTLLKKINISRDPSRLPLVSVLFNIDQTLDPETLGFTDLSATIATIPRRYENFEIFVNAVEDKGNVILEVQFNSDLFTVQTIRERFACYEQLLKGFVENPDAIISQLPILPDGQKTRILTDWNDTVVEFPAESIFTELISQQTARTPQSVAVEFENQVLTYKELEESSNKLAHLLRDSGIGKGSLVGLFIDRSIGMLVSLLATIKAGGAYVPLDPGFPTDRIAYMLENSGATVVISQEQLLSTIPENNCHLILIDDLGKAAEATNAKPIEPASGPEDPAYIIYTSGSTGKPKGVVVPHRGVTNFLCTMANSPGISSNDVLLAVTTLSFDIAVLELYLPLIVGAKVVIASRDTAMDGMELLNLITNTNATIMQATPATWRMLMTSGWEESSAFNRNFKVLVGGEALSRDLAAQLVTRTSEVWNMYGPTETTVWSTCHPIREVNSTIVIGKPIANTQLYILDANLQPVPVGVPGELLIGGSGVALGYWQLPAMTAEKFIDNPFFDSTTKYPSPKLYKTGDLARYLPDGTADFIGRNDNQVKVRGFRIELGEIEHVLMKSNLLHECVVVVREDNPGDQRIVAYYAAVPPLQDTVSPDTLREIAQKNLPSYMVPQHWISLPSLPKTLNGKIDRKMLPPPGESLSAISDKVCSAPETPRHKQLFDIWVGILKSEDFGIDDDFFLLGGHSLLGIQMLAKINNIIGISLRLNVLFQSPTIRQLAEYIEQDLASVETHTLKLSIPKRTPDSIIPASSQQRRMWITSYQNATAFRLRGPLNIKAIQEAFDIILDRHEALRTNICISDGELIQLVRPADYFNLTPTPLEKYSVTSPDDLISQLMETAARPIDTEKEPLFTAELVKIDTDDHMLMLIINQLIFDGWSYDLLFDEFCNIYNALSSGNKPALLELPIQYGDYSIWQKDWLQSDYLQQQVTFWANKLDRDVPALSLPLDYPRPSVQTHKAAEVRYKFDASLTDKLEAIGKQHGCTLFTVIIAIYAVLLHRLSNQKEVIVGTPISGRNVDELNLLMGCFVNTLMIKFSFSQDKSFSSWLSEVKNICLEAYNNQDAPFELIVQKTNPKRDQSHSPVFQTLFIYQDVRNRDLHLNNLQMDNCKIKRTSVQTDLDVWIKRENDDIWGGFIYPTALFKQETAQHFAETFVELAKQVCAQPTKLMEDYVIEKQLAQNITLNREDKESLPFTVIGLPETKEEEYLVNLWKELLKVSNVSTLDNFFNLGGDSFQAIQMIGRIEKETGSKFSPRLILLNTLGQIANQLTNSAECSSPKVVSSSKNNVTGYAEPFYFYNKDSQLFGILHHPTKSNDVNVGVLFCAPIAQEYMKTHWIFRQIADALCKFGFYVLRFDYSGCGDSSGSNFDGGINQWVTDTRTAEQILRDRTGVTKTITLATRIGAFISLQAHLNSSLVLWDPVENGETYIRDLEIHTMEHRLMSSIPEDQWTANELGGFEFKPEIINDIKNLNLIDLLTNSRGNTRIFSSKELENPVKWCDQDTWSTAIISNDVVTSITRMVFDETLSERGPQ